MGGCFHQILALSYEMLAVYPFQRLLTKVILGRKKLTQARLSIHDNGKSIKDSKTVGVRFNHSSVLYPSDSGFAIDCARQTFRD